MQDLLWIYSLGKIKSGFFIVVFNKMFTSVSFWIIWKSKKKKNQGVVKNDFSWTAPLQYHKFYSSVFISNLIKADCSPCPARDLAFLRECNPLVAEQIFKFLLNLWTTDPSGTCKVWTCIPHLTYNTMPAIIKVGSDLSTVGSFI